MLYASTTHSPKHLPMCLKCFPFKHQVCITHSRTHTNATSVFLSTCAVSCSASKWRRKEFTIYAPHTCNHTHYLTLHMVRLQCISRCVYATSTRSLRYEGLDMYLYCRPSRRLSSYWLDIGCKYCCACMWRADDVVVTITSILHRTVR